MTSQTYLVALGSNQRHPRFGAPRKVLQAAIDHMQPDLGAVLARSPIITSAPIGPSHRQYANAAIILASNQGPMEMLDALQNIEHIFGRQRLGQRWRSRTLDLDIVLWSGGIVGEPRLSIPHPLFRQRDFVLGPASAIAPDWRDPVSGLRIKHLYARLTRPRPIPR